MHAAVPQAVRKGQRSVNAAAPIPSAYSSKEPVIQAQSNRRRRRRTSTHRVRGEGVGGVLVTLPKPLGGGLGLHLQDAVPEGTLPEGGPRRVCGSFVLRALQFDGWK